MNGTWIDPWIQSGFRCVANNVFRLEKCNLGEPMNGPAHKRSPAESPVTNAHPEVKVYTVEEVAKLLRIGRSAAYEAVRRGQIPSVRLGRRLRVPSKALDQLLNPS